jgi:hypothetical protein
VAARNGYEIRCEAAVASRQAAGTVAVAL